VDVEREGCEEEADVQAAEEQKEGRTELARRSVERLGRGGNRSLKLRTLSNMKTLADEMMHLSDRLNSSALYINKLLEVLVLSPEEYSELSRAGVVEEPLTQRGVGERREGSGPNIAQLMQLAQGADLESLAEELLSRLREGN